MKQVLATKVTLHGKEDNKFDIEIRLSYKTDMSSTSTRYKEWENLIVPVCVVVIVWLVGSLTIMGLICLHEECKWKEDVTWSMAPEFNIHSLSPTLLTLQVIDGILPIGAWPKLAIVPIWFTCELLWVEDPCCCSNVIKALYCWAVNLTSEPYAS